MADKERLLRVVYEETESAYVVVTREVIVQDIALINSQPKTASELYCRLFDFDPIGVWQTMD